MTMPIFNTVTQRLIFAFYLDVIYCSYPTVSQFIHSQYLLWLQWHHTFSNILTCSKLAAAALVALDSSVVVTAITPTPLQVSLLSVRSNRSSLSLSTTHLAAKTSSMTAWSSPPPSSPAAELLVISWGMVVPPTDGGGTTSISAPLLSAIETGPVVAVVWWRWWWRLELLLFSSILLIKDLTVSHNTLQ